MKTGMESCSFFTLGPVLVYFTECHGPEGMGMFFLGVAAAKRSHPGALRFGHVLQQTSMQWDPNTKDGPTENVYKTCWRKAKSHLLRIGAAETYACIKP